MNVAPRYRRLTMDELTLMEKEFVDFLVLNGITADEWLKLKAVDPDRTEDLIVLFSDAMLEGALRKISFLEHRDRNDVRAFQCLKEKIVLMGMHAADPELDFTDDEIWQQLLHEPAGSIQVYTSEKPYGKIREAELFRMLQDGCSVSDGRSFKAISLALATNSQD